MWIFAFFLLATIISPCIATAIQSEEQNEILTATEQISTTEIPALGRLALLGSLYDARTQKFTGDIIFHNDGEAVTTIETPSIINLMSVVTKPSHLYELAAMDDMRSVSIHTDILKVGGHMGFLKETQDLDDSVLNVIWMKVVSTVWENLNLDYEHLSDLITFENFEKSEATHVVTGIKWGAGISAKFQFPKLGMDEDFEIFTGHPFPPTKKFEDRLPLSIQIYNDIPLPNNRAIQNYSQVQESMDKLEESISKTRLRKGKKLSYTLMRIKNFRSHFNHPAQNYYEEIQLNPNGLQSSIHVFDQIHSIQQKINNLEKRMNLNQPAIPATELKKIESLIQNFVNTTQNFLKRLKMTILSIAGGQKQNSDLEFDLAIYENDVHSFVHSGASLKADFEEVVEKIEFSEYVRSKNVTYFGRGDNLTDINFQETGSSIYILLFKNLSGISKSTIWLENRARFFQLQSLFLKDRFYLVDCDFKFDVCVNLSLPLIQEYQDGGLMSRNLDLWNFAKAGEMREKVLENKINLLESQLQSRISNMADKISMEYSSKIAVLQNDTGEMKRNYCETILRSNFDHSNVLEDVLSMCRNFERSFSHSFLTGTGPKIGLASCGREMRLSTQQSRLTYLGPSSKDEEPTLCIWVIWTQTGTIGLTLESFRDEGSTAESGLSWHEGTWYSSNLEIILTSHNLEVIDMGKEFVSSSSLIVITYISRGGGDQFEVGLRQVANSNQVMAQRIFTYLEPPPLDGSRHTMRHPPHDGNYGPLEGRFIFLRPLPGKKVVLNVEYVSTEAGGDYLQMYTFSTIDRRFEIAHRWSGSLSSVRVVAEVNQLVFLYFRSDEGAEGFGYSFTYSYQ